MPSAASELKHYTLQAVAGAGKTRSLIDEIFQSSKDYFKSQGVFPKICTATFTIKATQEVKERLMKRAIDENEWELMEWVSSPSQFMISTLHGITYSFLKNKIYAWNDVPDIMNERQKLSHARTAARSAFTANPRLFDLLEYFSFNDLISALLEFDVLTRMHPRLKPLSQKEMTNTWLKEIKKLLETNLLKNRKCCFYQKINNQPLELSMEDINDFKNTLKSEKTPITGNEDFSNLKELVENCHPQRLQPLEDYLTLFSKAGAEFSSRWKKVKEKEHLIPMEDIELLALESIRANPRLIESFSRDWDFWFIDEYQDTSPIQEEIISHLTKNAKKIWTVGDPQQSIYLFRNADPDIFERRKQICLKENPQGFDQKTKNYRSQSSLIYFFNDFFKNYFKSMTPAQKTAPTMKSKEPCAQFLIYNKDQTKPEEILACTLTRLLKEGVSPGNIGVLVKTNEEVSFMGSFLLNKIKLPVQTYSSSYTKRETLDMLFLLRFLINPFDNQNLIGLLRTNYFHVPDKDIAQMAQKNSPLWLSAQKNKKLFPGISTLQLLLQKSEKEGFSTALLSALENHSMIDLSYFIDPAENSELNLWSLLDDLKAQERKPNFRHTQWVNDRLSQNKFYHPHGGSAKQANPHFIQIMTIHQAKGLEFDHIILPAVDKKFSSSSADRFVHNEKNWCFSIQNSEGKTIQPVIQKKWKREKVKKEIMEQDRLLYVALTRAKKSVSFIYPACTFKKNKEGGFVSLKSSKFNENTKEDKEKNWLSRFSYFSLIENEFKNMKDNTCEMTLNINPLYTIGLKKFDKTPPLSVQKNKPKEHKNYPQPYISKTIPQKKSHIEPAAHFPQNIHSLLGSVKGTALHEAMYKIHLLGADNPLENFFSPDEKEIFKPAVHYVLNLKTPPMNILLKNGFGEWEFQYEKNNIHLSGRIDLWGEAENKIWIVDYKSGKNISDSRVWSQLNHYGFILREKHPQTEILLCAVWPFIQKCEVKAFTKNSYLSIKNKFSPMGKA